MVQCKSISESQNYKAAKPYIRQAYKGDSGSKSGLKSWTDGMESAALSVGVFFSVSLPGGDKLIEEVLFFYIII